ncbi:hypothetical protein FXE84_17800 [Vibrio cholerae]|uniref:hypothetical protein n=1 Tax=Vibrio cholerae TaxID=666 RepID=UPI0004E35918|nr:hypothetical protein [Vibrio cholerae]KFE28212.1 hypothetical protein DN30_1164 [Vibrio cholerae]TXY40922.1 hypothetical protein FXE84_17800 [Vibrio cholerae]GHW89949.1 hypothetical protein VCSRO105_0594 [Vibrio cholerae]
MSEYQERDIIELDNAGNHYGKHVLAMTREDLRSKSDIAAELGYRDMVIDKLTEENKQLQEALEQAKAMSIESINREDLVILISTGFRHAEINGSFEIDDLYAAFDSMVYKRKKLLSEIGGE